jgi:hypothetical protein
MSTDDNSTQVEIIYFINAFYSALEINGQSTINGMIEN